MKNPKSLIFSYKEIFCDYKLTFEGCGIDRDVYRMGDNFINNKIKFVRSPKCVSRSRTYPVY